ncbi:MAG: hypothetical protein KGY56_13675, partial [Desulfobacterales bacterium]|nr:hypothetical protein [Desulfobacterales bacterium]
MRKKLFLVSVIILLMFPAFSSDVLSGNISSQEELAEVNPDFMISPEKAFDWHVKKDKWTPAYSGTQSWHNFMEFVENKLEGYGVVDIAKNKWSYDHWSTSEWPDDSNWELVSDGENIKVASYGAYSGSTDENGITAELVYYDPTDPPDSIEDKIVVYETKPYPEKPYPKSFLLFCTMNDYEYCTDSETFPELFTPVPVNESISYNVWWQLRQTQKLNKLLVKGNAAGGVIIFDASYERLAGLYTFPVPKRYNVPNLYLARDAGAKVKQDAIKGKKATLKLVADVEEVETYQLIGYLPGKNYGTPDDEQIILVTHTDGCSISQENGALGILGIIHYFSNFPQKERPKTLMVFLDNRHYMPGMEHAFADEDFFALHPEAWDT